jgi:hypothetical protein
MVSSTLPSWPGTGGSSSSNNAFLEANQNKLNDTDDGGIAIGWIIFIIVLGVVLMGLSIWAYFEFFASQRRRISTNESRDVSYCNNMTGNAKSRCIETAMKSARQSRDITDVGQMATTVAMMWPTSNN